MAKRVVILGAGESGAGAAVLAKIKGFDVFVSDFSPIKEKYLSLLNEYNIEWESGSHTLEKILNADEVIKSPGIPHEAPMIQKLVAQGTPIISEIEFAGRYTNAKMICITGSNGKTTTTSLINNIISSTHSSGAFGNIGSPLSLAYNKSLDYLVCEVSSFQLESTYNFKPFICLSPVDAASTFTVTPVSSLLFVSAVTLFKVISPAALIGTITFLSVLPK